MTTRKPSRAKHPAAEVLRKREWPEGVPMPKIGPFASRHIGSRVEDQQLRAYYNHYGIAYCARLLGRSTNAVKIRASRIGIAELQVFWSAREDAYLRRNHLKRTSDELASKLGRTVVAVRVRLRHLGLRESKAWSPEDMAFLKEHYGTMKSHELARLLGRSGGAVRNMASEIGLSTSYRTISPEEELAIVALVGTASLASIGERFGIFEARVSKFAHDHGIDPEQLRQDRWSTADDQFLRDNWSTMPLPDIARHVGRNRDAVYAHAAVIGLSPDDSHYGRTSRWTPEDDGRLRELYGTMTPREVAALMGRGLSAIKHRARRLGLSGVGGG